MTVRVAQPSPTTPAADLDEVRRLVDDLVARLRDGLRNRLAQHARQGHCLEEIGSVDEIARRMLDVVPEASLWNDLLGPFYSTRQVSGLLGDASRQALADRRQRGTLLGLKTADGVVVYPAFQFDEHNRVLRGLADVLRCFRKTDADGWTVAGWLVSPLESLDGRSVIDWLRLGRDTEPLLALANDVARRFAQ